MIPSDSRVELLRAAGASHEDLPALLAYTANRFHVPSELPSNPLPDESFVQAWRQYSHWTRIAGNITPLRGVLVQLAFPIAAGVSSQAGYVAVTRRGAEIPSGYDVPALYHPETCRVNVCESFAGTIGVITAADRSDFDNLIRALTARNEPIPISAATGATMISGYNNWHRVRLLKEVFLSSGHPETEWPAEFALIKAQRNLYQDRFILLSHGPYSGVRAGCLGLDSEEWLRCSHEIRLHHEYAHYFTRRILGSMQNNLLDELMADFAGVHQAAGRVRADWILRFLGLEDYPSYRDGGRLQNYRGTPPLSDTAFRILFHLVWRSAWNLEAFDRRIGGELVLPRALMAIASHTIEELAADDAPLGLERSYQRLHPASKFETCEKEPCEKLSIF